MNISHYDHYLFLWQIYYYFSVWLLSISSLICHLFSIVSVPIVTFSSTACRLFSTLTMDTRSPMLDSNSKNLYKFTSLKSIPRPLAQSFSDSNVVLQPSSGIYYLTYNIHTFLYHCKCHDRSLTQVSVS